MKKLVKLLALCLVLMMIFAGCGSTDKETASETNATETASGETVTGESDSQTETTAAPTRGEFNATDFVTVENYKGIELKEDDIAASAEKLQEEIDEMLAGATTLEEVDRAATDTDTVNIDYKGMMNGEEFEGGTSTSSYDLDLGNSTFIDGFAEGLVGAKAGDVVTLELQFPDPYPNNTDYSGKDVTFEVTVHSVKASVTPEYNDATVSAQTSYTTVADYEAATKESIRTTNLETAVIDTLLNNATFADVLPENLVKYYQESYVNYYNTMYANYGVTLDDVLSQLNMDYDAFYEEIGVEDNVKYELIMRYIADKEGIAPEGEAFDKFVEDYAAEYSVDVDTLKSQYGEEELQYAYIYDKVNEFVKDNLVIK